MNDSVTCVAADARAHARPPARRTVRRCLLLLLAACAALPAMTSPVLAADVPDPLAMGPLPFDKVEYDAGIIVVKLADGVTNTSIPMRGSVTYPTGPRSSRIIVFVHGRHGVCVGPTHPGQFICGDETDADGTPVQSDLRSYAGYDYMAENLASHGYAVMSIEANVTNFDNAYPDDGANVRSQIIQGSLNLLNRWAQGEGPVVDGHPENTIGTKLVGRLDFSDGIGLMGHSRGGDAVTDFVTFNKSNPSSARWTLDGVFALAPTYFTLNRTPTGTNYGTLLPACDGDVSNLQGARLFENAKYAPGGDAFAKVQFYVQGTDHNFYNTVWTGDDWGTAADPACNRTVATSARLTPDDQRRVGGALMMSFLRRYVGHEKAFDPIMTGQVTLPAEDAPLESGKGADQEVKTSYIAPANDRLDVLRPVPAADPVSVPPIPADPNALTKSAQGGPLTTTGLKTFIVCRPKSNNGKSGPSLLSGYPDCPDAANNRSIGTQFNVVWEAPSTINAPLTADNSWVNVTRFGVLDLRASTIRDDPHNPPGDGFTPQSATQDFDVTLIDSDGHRATTNAARWTTSLEPSIGNRFKHDVLNGIRIPLTAFTGVNLQRIASVELGFGVRTTMGAINLADVMFQETPPPAAADDLTAPPTPLVPTSAELAPTPGPTGPVNPAVAVLGTPSQLGTAAAAAAAPVCKVDGTAPATEITQLSLKRNSILVRGRATDSGCPGAKGVAAGGVRRTLVSIWIPAGKGMCRYVEAGGKLGGKTPCDAPIGLSASSATTRSATSWSLARKAKLKAAQYHIQVSTFDLAGNAKTLKARLLRVR
jgi:hypothetical protein